MNPQPLEGKSALVTGAARGIGFAIAKRFAAEGASVLIVDINGDQATESARSIAEETGRKTASFVCDVANRAQVDEAVSLSVREFGGLDVAVANAGICPFIPFVEMSNEVFQRTVDVIVTGTFNTAQASAKVMIDQGRGGRLIFITSLATIRPDPKQADYAAAKGGVKMMASVLAQALGKHNITVNNIAPGVIYTDMGRPYWDDPDHVAAFAATNPIGRLGLPEDIAAAAVFLASDDASYITGSTIRVDGGREPIG